MSWLSRASARLLLLTIAASLAATIVPAVEANARLSRSHANESPKAQEPKVQEPKVQDPKVKAPKVKERETKAKDRARTRADARADRKAQAKARAREKAEARARAAAAAIAGGKVAVFDFKGEDTAHVRTQVVQVLKAKGLNVTTTLRPVDSAEQYRDMAATLGLAVYVHGQVKDTARDQAVATVLIRSGVTGRQIASARFSGDRRKLRADMEETLWTRVGPAFARACVAAAKPRRRHNAPMRIEAGTPIEPTPTPLEEGT